VPKDHEAHLLTLSQVEQLPRTDAQQFQVRIHRAAFPLRRASTRKLLKVTSRSLYQPPCQFPRYLNDQGISSVVAPLRTNSGTGVEITKEGADLHFKKLIQRNLGNEEYRYGQPVQVRILLKITPEKIL